MPRTSALCAVVPPIIRSTPVLLVLLCAAALSISCSSDPEPSPPPVQVSQPPAAVTAVAITRLDETPVTQDRPIDVGQRVLVEGTTSNPDATVCVLVHPLSSSTWWVQSLPSLPDRLDAQTWRWRTSAHCGTDTLGMGERFELLAVAESGQSVCVAGQQYSVSDASSLLRSLPRSNIVVAIRRLGQDGAS